MQIITHNLHLFEGTVQGLFGDANYRDQERRSKVADRIAASEVDLAGLCEVWADSHINAMHVARVAAASRRRCAGDTFAHIGGSCGL